jgi:ssDNA-binding Zn-finger/Zn-ribbon topoisomerase 1
MQIGKKKKGKKKSKILAAVTPLNQKTAIMTLTNGDSVDPIRIVTEKVSMEEIHDDNSSLKCSNCPNCKKLMNQLRSEQIKKTQLAKALSKATRMVSAEEIFGQESATSSHLREKTEAIRFSMVFGELRKRMAALFNNMGDLGKLQFVLEVNAQTFEPLSISVTRSLDHDGERILRLPEGDF